MPPPVTIRPDCDDIQIAGYVPRWIELPGGLIGVQRTVRIAPERIQHIKLRRPAWWRFCLERTPDTLRRPDDRAEAWVNSARPMAMAYLTRHIRAGTMWSIRGP